MRPRRALPVVLCLALALNRLHDQSDITPSARTAWRAECAASRVHGTGCDHLRVHTRDGRHTDLVLDLHGR